jgi:hypothetical protein
MNWMAYRGRKRSIAIASGGGGDSFTWYTGLNKANIPFHAGAGEYGAQRTIQEPSAPQGPFTDVTASSAAELATHIYTPGRRITLTGNIAASGFSASNISDVDIIVPPGILWNSPVLGGASSTLTRVRIRGSTVGSHSGGQVHQLWIFGTGTDLIIDGIDSSGTSDFFCMNLGPAGGFQRTAVVNCRFMAGGFAIGSTHSDLVVAGCSMLTGNDLTFTEDEAYGIRCYFETNDTVVIFNNDIRSNPSRTVSSHARFRCHPDAGLGYVWIDSNIFVERVENWICWVDAAAGGGSGDAAAVWFTNNQVISTGTGTSGSQDTPRLMGGDTNFAYVENNDFFSDNFTSNSSIGLTGITNGSSARSGNTYSGLSSDPSWLAGTPGDPSSIDYEP